MSYSFVAAITHSIQVCYFLSPAHFPTPSKITECRDELKSTAALKQQAQHRQVGEGHLPVLNLPFALRYAGVQSHS